MSTDLAVVRTAVVASFLAAGALAQAVPDGFDQCTALFQSDPGEESTARCFLEVSDRVGHRKEATKRLEECLEQDPSLPWVHYYLGRVSQGKPAFVHLRKARELFEAGHDRASAFRAQSELVNKLGRRELLDEAEEELERARGMLPQEDDDAAERLRLLEAMLATSRGDLDDALSQLIGIKERVIPGAPDELREELFYRLYRVYYELGQYREAGEALERSADIVRSRGDRYREAIVLYQIAAGAAVQPDRQRGQVVDLFQRALKLAESVGMTDAVANSHLELARLGQDVRFHLDRCLALSEEVAPRIRSSCLGALAFELKKKDPESARQKMDRAIAVAREAGSPWPSVYLWADRMPVSWATVSREEAIRESLSTLEDIEKLRESGMDDASSAQYFSVWAAAYRWLVGRLLDADDPGYGRESLELAFEVMERHRSRVLFENLQDSGAWTELDQQRRDEVRTYPSGILDQVEQTLRGDEALLAFQLGDWEDNVGRFAGGSWLFAVIHGRTRVYPLDRDDDLASRLDELASSGQNSDLRRIEEVYRELLEPAMAELPSEIARLWFVPDGRLHGVPFGILRPEGGEPLANRYEISVLPSAKIWLRWRHQTSEPPSGPALVLADPARPPVSPATGDADARDMVFESAVRGCRELPFARAEGKAILKRLGRSGVLLVGEEASESYLKRQDLGRFSLIHMASHAFVDDRDAGRSSVCLAPGSPDEDGDLRIHEIVNLKLDGQLVVLASCDSAAGPTLAGEGVMSLVRAFFLAGARAVVASLESLGDDEAKDLFIRFHDHLAAGRSAAAALRAAKQEIYADEGQSAAYASSAWSHVVLYGDGSLRPLHAGPAASVHSSWLLWAAGVLVIYLISIGVRIWLRRR